MHAILTAMSSVIRDRDLLRLECPFRSSLTDRKISGERLESALKRRYRCPDRESVVHPTRRFTLPALNARFTQHSGRSRRHYRTAEADPEPSFAEADVLGSSYP